MVSGSLLPAIATIVLSFSLEHDHVRPLPGSRVVADDERDGELVLTYRDGGSRVRKTVEGRIYSIEYEISNDVTAEDVVEFFTEQAEGLEGGDVHRTTENRLTFSFRRSDGGTTWCEIWATDGNYTLEIVDEASPSVTVGDTDVAPAPEPEPGPEPELEPEAEREPEIRGAEPSQLVDVLVFDAGADALPPGAGAILDDVATRLRHAPSRRLEIRARGDRAQEQAETVRSALVLFGIARERLTIVSAESGNEENRNRVELVLLR